MELCLPLKAVAYLCLRRLVAGFPPRRLGFGPRSSQVGFVVDKVALGQVFSEYFGFPCQFSFHRLFNTHHHLSSGAGTTGQLVSDVPSGLSLPPPQGTENYTTPSPKVFMSCCSINLIGVKFYVYFKMWQSSRMWRRVAWKIGKFWRNITTTLYRVSSVKTILLMHIYVRASKVLYYQVLENKCYKVFLTKYVYSSEGNVDVAYCTLVRFPWADRVARMK
jgi:hypothetical protein